jgi:hypothetical protein
MRTSMGMGFATYEGLYQGTQIMYDFSLKVEYKDCTLGFGDTTYLNLD